MKKLLEKRFSKENRKAYFSGLWVSFALSFMLAFYAPLVLFVSNLDDFLFDFSTVLPVLVGTTAILFIASVFVFTIAFLINIKVFNVALVGYFVVYAATYIQGNYMSSRLPVLDGTEVDWSLYKGEDIKTVVMWLIILALCILVIKFLSMEKLYSMVKGVSIFISAMLGITVAFSFISNEADRKETNLTYVSEDNLLEMSDDTNFVILLLDCVDSRNMNKIISKNPEYAEVFEDFTYYTNAMSTYPYTMRSVPFILTGKWDTLEQSFANYSIDAYNESPLFSELRERNYSIDLYDIDIPNIENTDWFNNVYSIKGKKLNLFDLARLELRTTNYTYLPFYFKKYYQYTDEDFKKLRKLDANFVMYSENDISFYNYIKENEIYLKDEKAFKFIHIEGAHPPYKYDKNVKRINNATYDSGIEASITITDYYLNKLKESGIYDNSVIIVMSDHGYDGGRGQGKDRQNPIFFVKGINEKHEMTYNDAPISYEDLQDAYVKLLDGADGGNIFEYKEGDERERRFILFGSHDKKHMYECILEGHASDSDSLHETGVTYTNMNTNVLFKIIAKPGEPVIRFFYNVLGTVGAAMILCGAIVSALLSVFYALTLKKYNKTKEISKTGIVLYVIFQLVMVVIMANATREVMFSGTDVDCFFVSFDLRIVSGTMKGLSMITVIVSVIASIITSIVVTKLHPIYKQQGKYLSRISLILYILLGFYLSWFMSIAVAFYWVATCLFKMIGMLIAWICVKEKNMEVQESGDKA